MLIVGGVNFFPSQVESIALGFEEVEPHYMIRLTKKGRLDHVSVDLETKPHFWADATKETLAVLARKIETKARNTIGFNIQVNIVEPMSIPRSEGKAKRVMDDR